MTESNAYGMPYEPTWTDIDNPLSGDYLYVVYDRSEGLQPAYAVILADNAQDAAEIAQEITNDRLLDDSDRLVIWEVEGWKSSGF